MNLRDFTTYAANSPDFRLDMSEPLEIVVETPEGEDLKIVEVMYRGDDKMVIKTERIPK